MPHSWAMAGRCRPPLVEPPVAATTTAAFSNALRVQMSRGRMLLLDQPHHRLARGLGVVVAVEVGRRQGRGQRQGQADRLGDAGHGVGGELAAAGAVARTGVLLQVAEVLQAHLAGRVLADAFEHVLHGDVAALPAAGQDRAAVEEDATARSGAAWPSSCPAGDLSQPATPTRAS